MLVGRGPLFNGHVCRDIFFFARSSYLFVLVFISSTAFVQSIRISWSSTRDTPLRRVLIRENATPSLPHLIVRHAIAPCLCLRLSSTPISRGTPSRRVHPRCCLPSSSSSQQSHGICLFFYIVRANGSRSTIATALDHNLLLSSQNASPSSLRGNATASFSPMCIPTVNDDDEGFVESLNALD